MQNIIEHIHQLYRLADAIRTRAKAHEEDQPGEACLDQLLADHAEQIADRLGEALAEPTDSLLS